MIKDIITHKRTGHEPFFSSGGTISEFSNFTKFTDGSSTLMAQVPLPTHLKHQPVLAIPYFDHDGKYSGNTDCQFLSIGWAQYDPHDLSAKIFRFPEDRWSRQSEEMPLHRVIDLANLIALALESHNSTTVTLPTGFLENQATDKNIVRSDGSTKRDAFSRALTGDHILRRRLSKLADTLEDLRKKRIV